MTAGHKKGLLHPNLPALTHTGEDEAFKWPFDDDSIKGVPLLLRH